jgi:clan AA aspartic protease
MGNVHVEATLANVSDPTRKKQVRFLVDTGAFYTVVPRNWLRALDVTPSWKERVRFADGRIAVWDVGEAKLTLDGRSVTTLVLFGKPKTQPLLGVYTLEGLAMTVDPRARRLRRMPVVLVAFNSRSIR